MLDSISHLTGATVVASDGEIGNVKDAFFDDRSWAVRYLVVDTGTWLKGREVLVSPYAVKQPVGSDKTVHVALTQQQVQSSPDVDTHQPVSRQHELEFMRHYQYPAYWDGGGLWAMGAMPYPMPLGPTDEERAANNAMLQRDFHAADVHLRSASSITGYDIQASDDSIGTVQDFVFDHETWAIRYLVVDTSRWWQGGHRVLVGMAWADSIEWATRKVHVHMTREQVQSSPGFEDVGTMQRDDEMRLHKNYQREGYWL